MEIASVFSRLSKITCTFSSANLSGSVVKVIFENGRERTEGGPVGELVHHVVNPFKIIGNDDRVQVTDTEAWPFAAFGRVVTVFPKGAQGGTGTLIGSHHVLTAGHCVFNHDLGGWANSITFSAAQNGTKLPFGTVRGRKVASVEGWGTYKDPDFDVGMIILESNLGLTVGVLGCDVLSDRELLNSRVSVSGYPGDKGGTQMWTDAQIVNSITSEKIFYKLDTMPGQSGAGLLVPSKPGLVGIHTTGNGTENGAVRFTPGKFGWIRDCLVQE